MDWSSCMHCFVCNKESFAVLHKSRTWRDPSNSSSTHFSLFSWAMACWVSGNKSTLLTQSCKSWSLLSLPLKDDDVEASSEALNLHKCSSSWVMIGFSLEGKLLERAWKPFLWLEEAAIFSFLTGERLKQVNVNCQSCNLPSFASAVLPL